MKKYSKILAVLLTLPAVAYAQETATATAYATAEPVSTENLNRFNSWSVSAGGGVALIQSADLNSIKTTDGAGKSLYGYSMYVSIDKAITHAFGLKLQYDKGETRQGYFSTKDKTTNRGVVAGRTQYDALSLLGDVNISNLLRRVDNKSEYRWALHGYGGIGLLAYRAYQADYSGQRLMTEIKPFTFGSMFGQAGAGLKYKINSALDLEARAMYFYTGDDAFDGGGEQYSAINQTQEPVSDNMWTGTLGLTYNMGKHESHLFWHDPMQELYYKVDVLANQNQDIEVCKRGDNDNDGVCDDWDRQLDTPAGARVDGAGVALDADMDGVIDLYDKCVTVAGPVSNNGCPLVETVTQETYAQRAQAALQDILFNFNKATLRPEASPKLDDAARIIKESNGKFIVIGHTDKRGNDEYNLRLSRERAAAVVRGLESRGVSDSALKSQGVGEAAATVPENASDLERMVDRKVEVRPADLSTWDSIRKSDVEVVPAGKALLKEKSRGYSRRR